MDITDNDFEKEVLKSEIPVFIEFWASWCPPCKVMEPVMDSLGEEYKNKVKFCKLNIDRSRITASKFDIKGVPTFMIFNKGEIIKREVAAKSESEIRKMIKEIIK